MSKGNRQVVSIEKTRRPGYLGRQGHRVKWSDGTTSIFWGAFPPSVEDALADLRQARALVRWCESNTPTTVTDEEVLGWEQP